MMKTFVLVSVLLVAVSALPPRSRRDASLKLKSWRPNPRITNGEDAAEGQFPYQISYQWGIFGIFQHVCGGSIISPTWVVTAGHCVTQVPGLGDYKIIAGITTLDESTEYREEIPVVERIVHPDFGGDVGPNDIALLRLGRALTLNDRVQPIQLPTAGAVPTGQSTLSGWGSTSTIDLPIMPNHLQTIDLPLLSFEECNAAIESLLEPGDENPLSEDSNICTGPLTGGVSACSGDSGGPLAQDNTLVGIVSWGFIPCGADGAPSVYTRASGFTDFIGQYVTDLPKF